MRHAFSQVGSVEKRVPGGFEPVIQCEERRWVQVSDKVTPY